MGHCGYQCERIHDPLEETRGCDYLSQKSGQTRETAASADFGWEGNRSQTKNTTIDRERLISLGGWQRTGQCPARGSSSAAGHALLCAVVQYGKASEGYDANNAIAVVCNRGDKGSTRCRHDTFPHRPPMPTHAYDNCDRRHRATILGRYVSLSASSS